MKKVFKITNVLMLITLLIIYSCSEEDPINVITLEDFTAGIDENPTSGQVIGTIEATQSVGGATLVYSITSQTPSGALSIDASSGELTVADATMFDFETNPVITAVVEVEGTENIASVTINLNNLEATLQDVTVSIDENPTNGTIVGTVQTSGSGTPNFSITSQTPVGALNIDANTGELSIADASLFDFETNPVITATISDAEATNTATVTINLTNINEITVNNLTVAIDENPTNGDSIGTITTDGNVNLNFAIVSQTPTGALNIDVNTGELTVADATLFDFETNSTITLNVTVDDAINSATATINLNDIDNIKSFLSTSQADYTAASNGDWVIITEAEYNNLANNLTAITRAGTTETEYNNTFSSVITPVNGSHTFSNYTTASIIPNNGYIIAFKYKVHTATNADGVKIKQSSTVNNDDFVDLGNVLPIHSGSYQDIFFVLKNNDTPVTANGYLGFFQPSAYMLLFDVTVGNGSYWGSGDTTSLNGLLAKKVFYQGLSTTQIQW